MEIKHLTEMLVLGEDFKIWCFIFHDLATSQGRDADLHPSIVRGSTLDP
jgi:hypothetical protein